MLSASDQASAYLGVMKKKSKQKMLTTAGNHRSADAGAERQEDDPEQVNHRQIGQVTIRFDEVGAEDAQRHAAGRQAIGANCSIQSRRIVCPFREIDEAELISRQF